MVCAVPDEKTLLERAEILNRQNVRHIVFREPDLLGEYPGDDRGVPTALATEPVDRKKRKIFSDLPLWRQ